MKDPTCLSDCLHTLVEDKDWGADEDRFYELDICGCEAKRDEERVFTQISKRRVRLHEQNSTMLLIRNITHIVNYEKAKNEGRY